jgi:hypothetical protein
VTDSCLVPAVRDIRARQIDTQRCAIAELRVADVKSGVDQVYRDAGTVARRREPAVERQASLIDPVESPAWTTAGGSLAASRRGHDQERRDQTEGQTPECVSCNSMVHAGNATRQ